MRRLRALREKGSRDIPVHPLAKIAKAAEKTSDLGSSFASSRERGMCCVLQATHPTQRVGGLPDLMREKAVPTNPHPSRQDRQDRRENQILRLSFAVSASFARDVVQPAYSFFLSLRSPRSQREPDSSSFLCGLCALCERRQFFRTHSLSPRTPRTQREPDSSSFLCGLCGLRERCQFSQNHIPLAKIGKTAERTRFSVFPLRSLRPLREMLYSRLPASSSR